MPNGTITHLFIGICISALIICSFLLSALFWRKNACKCLKLAADTLKTKVACNIFSAKVSGYYENREVCFQYDTNAESGDTIWISIKPKILPRKQKAFRITADPKPTPNTMLCGDKIYWEVTDFCDFKKYTAQDLVNILTKLTKAAEVVESDSTYYKNGW